MHIVVIHVTSRHVGAKFNQALSKQ